jgi:hypothetical protein
MNISNNQGVSHNQIAYQNMKNIREKEAINAYLKLLQNKGATSDTLYKRSLLLDKLTEHLAEKSQHRINYEIALNKTIETTPQIDRFECQNTAREFYPFWTNDIKAIAAFSLHYGFDIQSIKWKPLPASLDALTKSLDREVFDNFENIALNDYAQSQQDRGAEELVVGTRIKLAKIILMRLRDAPILNNNTYRMAVDITLPLFKVNEIRQLFLVVVREFYYFWEQDTVSKAA